jgi:hypothetical protein
VIRRRQETVLGAEDEIIIIAEDDSSIDFRPAPVMIPKAREVPTLRVEREIERQLILGWSYKAPIIIREYADYVLEGSEVDVVVKDAPEALRATVASLDGQGGVKVRLIDKDPLTSEDLESIQPFSYNHGSSCRRSPISTPSPSASTPRPSWSCCIEKAAQGAGRGGTESPDQAHYRDPDREPRPVSHAGVDDFIISNRMVSMLFAQMSEEPEIEGVYWNLFREEGSEIYVSPHGFTSALFRSTCRFGDLMRVAQKREGRSPSATS